jgi:hypothetical protein
VVEEFVLERRGGELMREELDTALERLGELEGFYDQTAKELVGPHGVIPPDLRKPLLAIGNRRALRVPAFGVLRGLYRTGYRIRHRGRAPTGQAALPAPAQGQGSSDRE